jgi:hypothetical protein
MIFVLRKLVSFYILELRVEIGDFSARGESSSRQRYAESRGRDD